MTLRSAAATVLLAAMLTSSSWPVRAQDGGEHTIKVGGIERTYLVHVPPNIAHPAPIVLMFHGGGGRPQAIARKTGLDAIADKHGFITIYPAGEPGPSGRGGTWNVGGPVSASSADDVAFVRAILRDVERTTPVDHARIYAAGLSMGGVFAYRLACEMSETFAAIAPVSATMVEPACRPSGPVAVLHIHGTDDDRIPLAGGRGVKTAASRSWPAPQQGIATWGRINGCTKPRTRKETRESCTTYEECRASLEFCVIAGGPHGWPDDVSAQVWAFFAAHPKPMRRSP